MAKMYPIWNIIDSCIYKASKSYGVRSDGLVSVKVGTSSKNSHDFLDHKVTHRELANGIREYRFRVDGVLIKKALVDKSGKYTEVYNILEEK